MEHTQGDARSMTEMQTQGSVARTKQPVRTADAQLLECMRVCAHYLRHQAERKGSQRRALAILCAQGGSGMTQRELMECMGIQPGSMSELLSKLEDQGCIARCKNPIDKRNVDLHLLDAGRDALQKMQMEYEQTLARLFACLGAQEKVQLQTLLKRLLDSWGVPCERCRCKGRALHDDDASKQA